MALQFLIRPIALFSVRAILMVLVVQGSAVIVTAQDPVKHSMFTGSLVQLGDDDDVLRQFEVQLFTASTGHFFHVIDDARRGCPWPESFGHTGPGIVPDTLQPHLVYEYNGHPYIIALPPLIVALPTDIKEESTWEQAGWQMTAIEQRNVNNTLAWVIETREPRGRRQTLTADARNGSTLRAETEVFMGQGDRFKLTLVQSAVESLEKEASEKVKELQDELLLLQSSLKRPKDACLCELSARQIADAAAVSDRLMTLASGTPLEILAKQIKTDVDQQQKRLASIANRAAELMNTDAPEFALSLMDGSTLKSENLKGKTVVLHFWDYRDSPLTEPYGQTGYLEFLFNQKKTMNVAVVGISTNPDLQSKENAGRGRRSVRKLSEFMNLSYPVGHDDGTLLKTFGDPRETRGQLPLWIVLNDTGKVTHYHAGYYEVDAAQGLKELETALADLLSKK